ncbi:TIGR02679 domain-containing protein [Streptomyces triculaminicus]|uniref:TIGR02679 domain-containing protein n=1 Tax=Streptomyces triculaminicus TaxID=2816232 RepID=UPI00340EDB7D
MGASWEWVARDEALAPLWAAVHQRLCGGTDPRGLASVRVSGLPPAGIAALRAWLDNAGRQRRGTSAVVMDARGCTRVPVRSLCQVLRLEPADLVALVEQAVGQPVVDRARQRENDAALREDLWQYAAARLPECPGLVARMRAAGISDNGAGVRHLIDALAAAAGKLPADPPMPLPKLAHDTAGDPHFFDLDTLAGSRLVALAAELTGQEEPSRPDRVRALLEDAGVVADRLTATVLLHHVAVVGDGPVDRRLREAVAPVSLHLFDLTRTPPLLDPGQILTVVENPSVLEAALVRGSEMALACTSGQLRAVDHALLQLAVDQGLALRYAGDLDGPGLSIAHTVARLYGADLVAMDRATLHDAAATPSAVPLGPLPAEGVDPQLARELCAGGHVVFQEHDAVLDRLLPASNLRDTSIPLARPPIRLPASLPGAGTM